MDVLPLPPLHAIGGIFRFPCSLGLCPKQGSPKLWFGNALIVTFQSLLMFYSIFTSLQIVMADAFSISAYVLVCWKCQICTATVTCEGNTTVWKKEMSETWRIPVVLRSLVFHDHAHLWALAFLQRCREPELLEQVTCPTPQTCLLPLQVVPPHMSLCPLPTHIPPKADKALVLNSGGGTHPQTFESP